MACYNTLQYNTIHYPCDTLHVYHLYAFSSLSIVTHWLSIEVPVDAHVCSYLHKLSCSYPLFQLQWFFYQLPGYSGADVANLCKEAALGPVRDIKAELIASIKLEDVRSILYKDFIEAIKQVKASVAQSDLVSYLDWNSKFGSWDIPKP